ncbi:hypothetical protein K456DRAFT_1721308 [Colletotrichum gloeosporioides 23]|nr:hypothetical protein K456DRAFT_1721308 [Colletotrichum gloeosporioides 23]KAJ0278833.1 hypothetical protein COL940_007049 [Colletotrichum noveboracense]KAJ0284266.1 hypothetical protein CBS470a_006893 [Colletotrichum nupharicola]
MPQYNNSQADTHKDPSSKHEAKEMMAQQQREERTEHSKRGANMGKPPGVPEYVARKEHAADVQH